MPQTNASVDKFDLKALNRVAAEVRLLEAQDALTAAAARKGNLSLQPKLSFKRFRVKSASAAVSPDCSYRLLHGALSEAEQSITAYVYNISAPFILSLLKEKLKAGVKVRIMVDPNDPNDQKSQEFAKLRKLGDFDLKLSPSSNDRPVFTVCHQKYVVIDHETTIVQSANWAGTAFPQVKQAGGYSPGNREWLIRVDDKPMAAWFEDLFQKDWSIPSQAGLAAAGATALVSGVVEDAALFVPPAKVFDLAHASKQVELLPLVSPLNYQAELESLLTGAKSRIWLQHQYITAGDGVNELLEIVHKKAKTCDVRIILSPKFPASWDKSVKTLKAAGLYSKLKAQSLKHVVHCHNKGVLVDEDYAVVSSTNWSENSITRAREAGLLIRSKELTNYFADVFDLDWNTASLPQKLGLNALVVGAAEMI